MRTEAFWFGQYGDFSLYESSIFGFPLEWKVKEPPSSVWVDVRRDENGSVLVVLWGSGMAFVLRNSGRGDGE